MNINWGFFKAIFTVVIIVAALVGASLLLRRADMSMPSLFRPPAASRLFMSMEGFRITQSDKGRVAWRMQARNADLYENKEARLKDLSITFISPDHGEAELIGEVGVMDTVSGNASVSRINQDVRIVTSEGYLLTTSSLFWKARERLVSTPDPFKLLGREIYLEGKGLSADVDMRKVVVNNNVKAVLQE